MGSTRQKCLCRVPGPGGTRQNLFSENKKKLPSAQGWHSAKFFFKKIKTNFAKCLLGPALGKDIFAECSPWHSAKYIYFFDFGPKFFCVAL